MQIQSERPVAFASCTLSKARRNYAQLDKEAFSIIFGVTKFHQFLYGWRFVIVTDHKPLLQLLGPHKPTPVHAAARLQRWSLMLASYHYDIECRRTIDHANADSMPRVPLSSLFEPKLQNLECHYFFLEMKLYLLLLVIGLKPKLKKIL